MTGILILIGITVFSIAVGIVSSNGTLINNGWPTRKGFITFSLIIIVVGLSIWQYILNESRAHRATIEAEEKQEQREKGLLASYSNSVQDITNSVSVTVDKNATQIKNKYDSSAKALQNRYDSSTINIFKALASYGLEYNAAQKRIEKTIKNSSKPDPDLNLCHDPVKIIDSNETDYRFQLYLCNYQAPATNINFMCYQVLHLTNGAYVFGGAERFLSKNESISQNEMLQPIYLTSKSHFPFLKHIFYIVKGTFTNKEGTVTYPFENICVYDAIERKSGFSTAYFQEKIYEVLQQQGIK